jgi:histidinol phosphatase-like enzyme (inositol monophosphatase family)
VPAAIGSRSSDTAFLASAARAACAAADAARREVLPRFRSVEVETKADGTPVTEADRAAERAIRAVLASAPGGLPVMGEEQGGELENGSGWVVDPIDGTISFVRGLPLFATLIALVLEGEPVLGVIDLPALDERYIGWRGGGAWRNGRPTRVSQRTELGGAIVSLGEPMYFDRVGERAAWERITREVGAVRGYTDACGHAFVLSGGVDAVVDVWLSPWDAAATRALVPAAGGACVHVDYGGGKCGLVLGSPALVERLASWLAARGG